MIRKLPFILFFVLISYFGSFAQTLFLLDTTFSVNISADNDPVYIYNYSIAAYKITFIDDLREALRAKNIQLVLSIAENVKPYYLNISKFRLSEEIHTETVDDTASEQYGQSYDLSTCEVKAEYVLSTPDHQIVGSWKSTSLREERLSNSRGFFDWLFGLNKNNTEYHEKELNNETFLNLIESVCTRTAKKLVKKVKRNKKK